MIGLAGIVGAGAAWYIHETADQPSTFRTVAVERGNLLATINATAVIEAEEVVDVGAQIAGMVQAFGHDLKDPEQGHRLRFAGGGGHGPGPNRPALYKATLHQAQANLANSQAMLEQAKTNLKLSQLNWDRAQTLHERKVMTQADYDSVTGRPRNQEARARRRRGGRRDGQGQFGDGANQRELLHDHVAGQRRDRRSPRQHGPDGRFQPECPSLFLIARDLTRMQLWASVNEADIGQIHPGQSVQFTVDAFPNTIFRGEVSQIRLNANMTQNVVTYTVVVTTDNSSGRLLPYMTANVKFEVAKRDKVLLVPSAALRWKPQPNQIVADAREAFAKSSRRRGGRSTGIQIRSKSQVRESIVGKHPIEG